MKEDEKPPVEDVKKESSEVSSQQPAAENMVDEKKPDGQGADDGSFTSGTRLVVIMVAVLMSLFLVALDRTIIATAVPEIANQFHALTDINWYASAYLITSCATQLTWGKVYTFYSTKFVLLSAIVIFEVGSALCGAAPNSTTFIVGRAIAGTGSAGIFSGTTVVIAQVVPLRKRPVYVGMMGSIFGVASIIGPLMGGAFTDRVTWRWCFYINLPIGGVTMAVLLFLLNVRSKKESASWQAQVNRLDPIGSVLFLPSATCFLLALQLGGTSYPWNNGRIIALFVVSGVLMIAFVAVQIWRQEDATVPPRIFCQRSIASGTAFSAFVGGGLISMLYALPIWFQAVKGTTAVQSGIDTIPMVLSLVVGSILSGSIITATGHYVPWMYVSTVLMSIGAGLTTTFKADTNHSAWIGYQVLFGFGIGTGMQQASLAAQTVLNMKDLSTGVSLMFFAQSLGGALFVAISQSLFSNALASNLAKVPGLDVQAVLASGAKDLSKVVPLDKLPLVLPLYNDSLRRSFIVSLAVSCLMILPTIGMEYRTIKKKEKAPAPEATEA
ncbi:major facilitator superfamily transporter [Trichophyton tonsurans CBS 112818]|uniref:Major facilitator superfamily transporter n=1 Tax=Trichophyton tonsurans (strain CBS 112818) TaxID=647933 RepID=F2RRY9_TRIT1|nr:major facilitator superfamily transporter [Trichophyton tonsurans CBS 112818]